MGLSTADLSIMLLQSFVQNDTPKRFGFILSTYEYDDDREMYKTDTVIATNNAMSSEMLFREIAEMYSQINRIEDDDDDDDMDYDDDDDEPWIDNEDDEWYKNN